MHDNSLHHTVAASEQKQFEADVCAGLASARKSLPCQYFYDERGSQLFEQITGLAEYYPTRTEIGILQAHADAIASRVREGTVLVEFGSGSSLKTDLLLAACPAITHYVPIDVSPTMLEGAKSRLERKFPRLAVEPVLGDFAGRLVLPDHLSARPKLGFFPGSTIGNFSHDDAVRLLSRFRQLLGPGARLIVGADLRKSPDILIPAYNDAAGVTAAFNLNLLARINRELSGTFDVGAFRHEATYDAAAGRVEMWLVSTRAQTATCAGRSFSFAAGERIHTEISQKYGIDEFRDLARSAGWQPGAVWTDAAGLFSLHELESPA